MGAAASILTAFAGYALAQAPAAAQFPESLDRETLLLWMKRETDITAAQVVAVTPPAITALVSTFPAGAGQGPRIVIRAEALNADTYGRTGALSWHVSLNADCANRRLKMGETTGYTERNLLGERRILRPADSVWRAPDPGTALENAWRAACEEGFHGPLSDNMAISTAGSDDPYRKSRPVTAESQGAPASEPPPARVRTPPPKHSPKPGAVVVKGILPAGATPAVKPQPAPKAAPSKVKSNGPAIAQLGSYATDGQARAVLAKVKPRLGGRGARVETAVVAGRSWSRALITGFANSDEAERFCAKLRPSGQPCMARAR